MARTIFSYQLVTPKTFYWPKHRPPFAPIWIIPNTHKRRAGNGVPFVCVGNNPDWRKGWSDLGITDFHALKLTLELGIFSKCPPDRRVNTHDLSLLPLNDLW